MVFIPILWATQDKASSKKKWELVRNNRSHLYAAVVFGILGVIPQLIYWKMASGSFIYNVGSKWVFLTPWFRVLFGGTNGWFIYTPITIFFIAGLFYIKSFPFKKSVIVFCLLNIWIVISWFDWKYGATYSTRALVQSYPVFALPFAAIIHKIISSRLRVPFLVLGGYLIFVNFIQLDQYYKTILHFRDMNFKYYSRIYLNRHPSPLDVSLLDTDEILKTEDGYSRSELWKSSGLIILEGDNRTILDTMMVIEESGQADQWLHIKGEILASEGFGSAYLTCSIQSEDSIKTKAIRLFSPISSPNQLNPYEFYYRVPNLKGEKRLKLAIESSGNFKGHVEMFDIALLSD